MVIQKKLDVLCLRPLRFLCALCVSLFDGDLVLQPHLH